MTKIPDEWADAPREEWADVFETPEGELVVLSQQAVATAARAGDASGAFQLMRYQLSQEARRVLRAAGCPWRRADALWRQEFHDMTFERELAAMVLDAADFMRDAPTPGSREQEALNVLAHLKWQADALDAAETDADRELLRRMAVASTSLGISSALAGIDGAVPSLRELAKDAEKAKRVQRGGDAGRETNTAKAERWRGVAGDFVDGWLRRHQPESDAHGMKARIQRDLLTQHPEMIGAIGGSSLEKLIRKKVEAFFAA